jgi:hypothetical protein
MKGTTRFGLRKLALGLLLVSLFIWCVTLSIERFYSFPTSADIDLCVFESKVCEQTANGR